MFWIGPGNVSQMFYKCSGNMQAGYLNGLIPEYFQNIFRTFPEHFQNICGTFPEHLQDISGTFPEQIVVVL